VTTFLTLLPPHLERSPLMSTWTASGDHLDEDIHGIVPDVGSEQTDSPGPEVGQTPGCRCKVARAPRRPTLRRMSAPHPPRARGPEGFEIGGSGRA